MSGDVVVPLDPACCPPDEVGGKAATLAHLSRAGFPVPAGFAVKAVAFEAFVMANALGAALASRPRRAAAWPDVVAWSRDIRHRFETGTMPSGVRASILCAYDDLCRKPPMPAVAVRSSALSEDSATASHAGQHDSFLNVNGGDAVLGAVVRCWSSLFTPRALVYVAPEPPAAAPARMAVVVQRLILAEAAGVVLTRDPVGSGDDELVVTATWGLGEALASGRVTPDTLAVERRTGRVVRRHIGDKAVRSVLDAEGTRLIATSPEARRRAVLAADAVAALARLAEGIEAALGAPQEIEWALAEATIYVVQSRPLTGPSAAPASGERTAPRSLRG